MYNTLDIESHGLEGDTQFSSLQHSEPERRPLVKLDGLLHGKAVRVMIDSGATSNFVASTFVGDNGLPRSSIRNHRVKLANGEAHAMRHSLVDAPLQVGNIKSTESFFVFPLPASSHDVILGVPWLARHNPQIDWSTGKVRVNGIACTAASTRPSRLQVQAESKVPMQKGSSSTKVEQHESSDDEELFITYVTLGEPTKEFTHRLNAIESTKGELERNARELKMIKRFPDVFPLKSPMDLPPHRPGHDFSIELVEGAKPPCLPLRKMSPAENEELQKQLKALLDSGFIVPSRSPYGAAVVFARKKTGELRLCIDYRALNAVTIRDRYAIPHAESLIDQVAGSKCRSTLDLTNGYHQLRIVDKDVDKTCFRTRFGSFAFKVLPFGVCNGPGRFMAFLQSEFRDLLDRCLVIYVDDLLIYSPNEEQHEKDLTEVLSRLRKLKLHCKLKKCKLFRDTVNFLGFELRPDGLAVEQDKIQTILAWPVPKNASELRSLIGLATFYRRFIRNFSGICAVLFALLKKDVQFVWTDEHQKALDTLKHAMSTAPVLATPKPGLPFVVTTDASDFAIGAVLSQEDPESKVAHPICFMSKKLSDAERRWPTHEQELFAVVHALQTWKHYLWGAQFKVYTDHRSLLYLYTQPKNSARQVRWIELLADFDVGNKLYYQEGKSNVVADALSRRPDLKPEKTAPRDVEARAKLRRMIEQLLPNLNDEQLQNEVNAITSVDASSLLDTIRAAYHVDPVLGGDAPAEARARELKKLTSRDGLFWKEERIFVPDDRQVKTLLLHEAHDAQHAGHLGVDKTVRLLARRYVWPRMHKDVESYVSSCVKCQQNKSSNTLPQGFLQPLDVPHECWHTCTMDLITALPRTRQGKDAIIVVVDKFSKLTHVWPTTTTVSAVELAKQFFREIVRLHGFPAVIVSDRDPRFTSLFWSELWRLSGTRLAMSTSFHPQSDGQTERQNRTLEEMLRAFVSVRQDDWDDHLPAAELAINNSTQASSKETPFFLTFGKHVKTPLDIALPPTPNQAAADVVQALQAAHEQARAQLLLAQQRQAKYANKRRVNVEFKVGESVYLSTRNLQLKNRAPKLDAKFIGPYRIIERCGPVNYRLELPASMQRMFDKFHVDVLRRHKDGSEQWPDREQSRRNDPELIDEQQHWEVEAILAERPSRSKDGEPEFLVAWKGYPRHEATWERHSNLSCPELMRDFKQQLDRRAASQQQGTSRQQRAAARKLAKAPRRAAQV